MTVSVEIADRLYDYTDEEKATYAVADFQGEVKLADADLVALWNAERTPMRDALEKRIFDAVDANGSAKRAEQCVPDGVSLYVSADEVA